VVPSDNALGDDQRRQHRRRVIKHRVRDVVLVVTLGISARARENNAPEARQNGQSAPGGSTKGEIPHETNAVAFFCGELCGVLIGAIRLETIDVVLVSHHRSVSYFSVLRVSENVADTSVYVFGDVFRVEKRRRAGVILRSVIVSSRAGDAGDYDVLFAAGRREEAGESRRVRGVVDGVCDVRAHCRDLFMGDV
tara:strand:- start:1006 stop:1587 length:582 start_codon:yes stop_codon:yes gene_type:complete